MENINQYLNRLFPNVPLFFSFYTIKRKPDINLVQSYVEFYKTKKRNNKNVDVIICKLIDYGSR